LAYPPYSLNTQILIYKKREVFGCMGACLKDAFNSWYLPVIFVLLALALSDVATQPEQSP